MIVVDNLDLVLTVDVYGETPYKHNYDSEHSSPAGFEQFNQTGRDTDCKLSDMQSTISYSYINYCN